MDDPKPKPAMLPPGAYINFLRVAQARSEFHFAFGQQAPGQAPQLHSTFVTTPLHAKAMLKALSAAIERYEEQFGEVPTLEADPAAA